MENKKAYEDRMQAQLDMWQAEINKLTAKAMDAGADANIIFNEQMDILKANQNDLQQKLEELKNRSDDAWEDLITGMEDSMEIFSEAMSSAISRFLK